MCCIVVEFFNYMKHQTDLGHEVISWCKLTKKKKSYYHLILDNTLSILHCVELDGYNKNSKIS